MGKKDLLKKLKPIELKIRDSPTEKDYLRRLIYGERADNTYSAKKANRI